MLALTGGREERTTDRGPGSGPFLGGLDCLAVVAICKTDGCEEVGGERKNEKAEKQKRAEGLREKRRESAGR